MDTIQGLHKKLMRREISALELAENYLSGIEERKGLNAYITVTDTVAIEQAKRADERIKKGNAPLLCGLPMALKDNLSTDGIKTTCASKMLSDYVPFYDAFVYKRLKEQGAVLLGKTNMDEFSMGSFCETGYFGAVKNPKDCKRVAGGSSGGSAAAVASGLSVYALGSDTGGSVRVPAAYVGIVGLSPTYGAVSRRGLIAYASDLDRVGVLAKTVSDVASVFDAIAVKDERDMTSCARERLLTVPLLEKGVREIKAVLLEDLTEKAEEETSEGVKKAAKLLEEGGVCVTAERIGHIDYAPSCYRILASAGAAVNLSRYDGLRYGHAVRTGEGFSKDVALSRSEGFSFEVKRRILFGNYVLSSEKGYIEKARAAIDLLKRDVEALFQSADILLCPTVKSGAPLLGEGKEAVSDDMTVLASLLHLPAVSIPVGCDKNGMPLGLQIIGKPFEEGMILRAARYLEQALALKGGGGYDI